MGGGSLDRVLFSLQQRPAPSKSLHTLFQVTNKYREQQLVLFLFLSLLICEVCGECASAKGDEDESEDHGKDGRRAEIFEGKGDSLGSHLYLFLSSHALWGK